MKTEKLSISELSAWCSELIKGFASTQIILLEGPLGAGKTELVKVMVHLLGAEETSSPTYSLINEYPLNKGKAYHVDLYRIEDGDDLESTGFWDLFEEEAIIFIEWPSKMNIDQLPLSWSKQKISITKSEDDSVRLYHLS